MNTQDQQFEGLPGWARQVMGFYMTGQAHVFLLHNNVRDYVTWQDASGYHVSRLEDALTGWFGSRQAQADGQQVIMFLDQATGLTFAREEMEQVFMSMAGIEAPEPVEAPSELAALLGDVQAPALDKSIPAILPALSRVLARQAEGTDRGAVLLVRWPEFLAPADGLTPADRAMAVSLLRWASDPEVAGSGNVVFILARDRGGLQKQLLGSDTGIAQVLIPLPAAEERRKFVEWMLTEHRTVKGTGVEGSVGALASLTAGLSIRAIEDVGMRGAMAGGLTREMIKARKAEIIAGEFGDLMEIIDPDRGFEILGGLEMVKSFFTRAIIKPLSSGVTRFVPMGVLMAGPSGTGKSLAAECLAFEAGVNCVRLDVGRLMGKFVGQSEGNLDRALMAIDALAPVIVFMDEVDQTVRRDTGNSGDSGVGSRMFRRLMEYMSDTSHRGRVVFLAATNRPDLLDAAWKRPGRFDKIVLFPVPSASDLPQLMVALLRKQGCTLEDVSRIDPYNWGVTMSMFDGWTGAEIEGVIVKALELSSYEDRPLSIDLIVRARATMAATTKAIEEMTNVALAEVNDLDLVPAEYVDRWQALHQGQ